MSIAARDVWAIKDSATFLDFAREHLDWPFDLPFEEVTFDWQLDELGLEATKHLQHINQLRPMDGNPWGIFFLEFDHHRLPVTDLRQVLRALVKKQRADARAADRPRWRLENLLFIATYGHGDDAHTTFAHFAGAQPHNAKLSLFHVVSEEPCRTLCEFNLPALKWPEVAVAAAWEQEWAQAFDVEKVTAKFFTDYAELFEYTKTKLKGVHSEEARHDFTQRLFNRLLFVTFIQKKRWLDSDSRYLFNRFDQVTASGRNYYDDFLHRLFFWALRAEPEMRDRQEIAAWTVKTLGDVPFLNGGLFEEVDRLDAHKLVQLDNDVFDRIFDRLLDRYNFTVTESTPLDIEVAIDPEMLGKVFEELVTGRHASGSYYTPKPVVAFMCREALKGYLGQALRDESEAGLAAFVEAHEPEGLRDPEKALEALRRVRVCDPACGSGAYLLGMMQELLALRACLFAAQSLDGRSSHERKLEIIQHSLYGVDLDPFAVNIARLRLWLSLAVEYEGTNPPPLPNLDFKIEVGDSLTGPNPEGAAQIGFRRDTVLEFQNTKARFLRSHGTEKDQLRKEIDRLREEVKEWTHPTEAVAGFDWPVEFAEAFTDGGFDIALANPPYVRQELIGDTKPRLVASYPDACTARSDLYCYFYARALQLLKPGGQHVFICSNSWLDVGYGGKLQGYLLQRAHVRAIYDSAVERQFATADINTIISLLVKGKPQDTTLSRFISLRAPFEEALTHPELRREITRPSGDLWSSGLGEPNAAGTRKYEGDKWGGKYLRAPDIYWTILEKGKDKLVRLGDIADVRFGIKTGCNEFFYLPSKHFAIEREGDYYRLIPKHEGLPEGMAIETEYLARVIFSLKEIRCIEDDLSECRRRMISCHLDKSRLRGTRLLKYIMWGAKEGFHTRPTCAARRTWYSIGQGWQPAPFVFPAKVGERMIVLRNVAGVLEDKKLYGVIPRVGAPTFWAAVLNSTLCRFLMDLSCRQLTGAQAIADIDVNVVLGMQTPCPDAFPLEAIERPYALMSHRPIDMHVRDEYRRPDRAALDDVVFDAIGLTEREKEAVYEAVIQLVEQRLQKADSV